MIRYRFFVVVFVTIGLFSQQSFAQKAQRPLGRYCGLVYHKGENVKSEIYFTTNNNGLVSGIIQYDDEGIMTSGTIEELPRNKKNIAPDVHSTDYEFKWQDKYGEGHLLLMFDDNYDGFYGFWGVERHGLHYEIDGDRCNDYTS